MLPSRRYGSDALRGNDMITAGDFSVAMPIAEPLFERLQNLYQQLPETLCTCEHPGVCCMYMPEMTVLEALQWIRLIAGNAGIETRLQKALEKVSPDAIQLFI